MLFGDWDSVFEFDDSKFRNMVVDSLYTRQFLYYDLRKWLGGTKSINADSK